MPRPSSRNILRSPRQHRILIIGTQPRNIDPAKRLPSIRFSNTVARHTSICFLPALLHALIRLRLQLPRLHIHPERFIKHEQYDEQPGRQQDLAQQPPETKRLRIHSLPIALSQCFMLVDAAAQQNTTGY
ncbi:hypothetical protein [Corynebacterium diphtheriae]|uniref:hypothetical protein n=1 Tax=Corynebacterium diphtheriae TaxID=1717 RepID=UPI0035E44240